MNSEDIKIDLHLLSSIQTISMRFTHLLKKPYVIISILVGLVALLAYWLTQGTGNVAPQPTSDTMCASLIPLPVHSDTLQEPYQIHLLSKLKAARDEVLQSLSILHDRLFDYSRITISAKDYKAPPGGFVSVDDSLANVARLLAAYKEILDIVTKQVDSATEDLRRFGSLGSPHIHSYTAIIPQIKVGPRTARSIQTTAKTSRACLIKEMDRVQSIYDILTRIKPTLVEGDVEEGRLALQFAYEALCACSGIDERNVWGVFVSGAG